MPLRWPPAVLTVTIPSPPGTQSAPCSERPSAAHVASSSPNTRPGLSPAFPPPSPEERLHTRTTPLSPAAPPSSTAAVTISSPRMWLQSRPQSPPEAPPWAMAAPSPPPQEDPRGGFQLSAARGRLRRKAGGERELRRGGMGCGGMGVGVGHRTSQTRSSFPCEEARRFGLTRAHATRAPACQGGGRVGRHTTGPRGGPLATPLAAPLAASDRERPPPPACRPPMAPPPRPPWLPLGLPP